MEPIKWIKINENSWVEDSKGRITGKIGIPASQANRLVTLGVAEYCPSPIDASADLKDCQTDNYENLPARKNEDAYFEGSAEPPPLPDEEKPVEDKVKNGKKKK